MAPRITLLVTACGRTGQLLRTLERCREQARRTSCELLLVINDAPARLPTGHEEDLRGRVDRLLFAPEPGKSRALNRALPAARGEIVAFIDDDAEPDPGWLEALTAPLLADGSPWSGTGGPVLPIFPAGGPPAWYRQILARNPSCFLGPFHYLGSAPKEYPVPAAGDFSPLPFGTSCAYRREELLERPFPPHLGPNRETGGRGGEDTAVALRFLLDGKRLLHVPEARVYHPVVPERLTLEYVKQGYERLAEELFLLRQHFDQPLPERTRIEASLRRAQRRANLRWSSGARRLRHDLRARFLKRQLSLSGTA